MSLAIRRAGAGDGRRIEILASVTLAARRTCRGATWRRKLRQAGASYAKRGPREPDKASSRANSKRPRYESFRVVRASEMSIVAGGTLLANSDPRGRAR